MINYWAYFDNLKIPPDKYDSCHMIIYSIKVMYR